MENYVAGQAFVNNQTDGSRVERGCDNYLFFYRHPVVSLCATTEG